MLWNSEPCGIPRNHNGKPTQQLVWKLATIIKHLAAWRGAADVFHSVVFGSVFLSPAHICLCSRKRWASREEGQSSLRAGTCRLEEIKHTWLTDSSSISRTWKSHWKLQKNPPLTCPGRQDSFTLWRSADTPWSGSGVKQVRQHLEVWAAGVELIYSLYHIYTGGANTKSMFTRPKIHLWPK